MAEQEEIEYTKPIYSKEDIQELEDKIEELENKIIDLEDELVEKVEEK